MKINDEYFDCVIDFDKDKLLPGKSLKGVRISFLSARIVLPLLHEGFCFSLGFDSINHIGNGTVVKIIERGVGDSGVTVETR